MKPGAPPPAAPFGPAALCYTPLGSSLMLHELHIENFALIDRLAVELGGGLNLLTGETGSGKSIVVDALDLLLGGKPSTDMIRAGAERAVVCGVFQATLSPALARLTEEHGIETDRSGEFLVKRELHTTGRTRSFINDRPATVTALRGLAPWLADIHGQNEQQALFLPSAQLDLLDRFGGAEELAAKVAEAYAQWKRAEARLNELSHDEQEKLRLLDLWAFQKQEIEAASPLPDEDRLLADEKRVLANSARIHAAAQGAYDQLYEGAGAAAAGIAAALRGLEEAARFDPALDAVCDPLRGTRIAVEDAAFALRDYLERLESNPQRLEEVEDRLAVLDRLKRKYGPSLADVLAHRDKVAAHLEELETSDELAREARKQLDAAADSYRRLAGELSAARKAAAVRLEKTVAAILADLAMDNTAFRVQFLPAGDDVDQGWKANGTDRAQFLISANPGEPLRPVSQVASGGELSRIMLALKTAVQPAGHARRRPRPGVPAQRAATNPETARTLVFDEVDAGIGGRVAEIVGRKLKALTAGNQVVCVTHLAQIASFADHHYFVEKLEREGRTITLVRRLEDGERAAELARMLSGAHISEAVLKHARDMLKAGGRA